METIHNNYLSNFIKEDGREIEFDDVQQFYTQIENIHNIYAGQLKEDGEVDKKMDYIEPFCIINVDESDNKNRISETNLYTETDQIDPTKTESPGGQSGVSSSRRSVKVKKETEHVITSDEDNDDDDDDGNKNDDDFDVNYLKDDEDEAPSSDSSYVESKTKEKTRTKSVKKKKKKRSSTSDGGRNKKVNAASGALDENSQRLLKYIEMKCDICCDERVFEAFSDIQNHFLDVHQQNGYVMCCNRKFRRIGRVLQHCTWHENPEAFK